MQYLGGKSRIAKEIAQIVAPQGFWWEPFCGGLSVSVQLAKFGPGLISDANPALISLYTSVARGWLPPEAITAEEHHAARSLPDSDPRKAFSLIGASYGGDWSGGYTGPRICKDGARRDPARASRAVLLRDISTLSACHFRLLSFFDVDPQHIPSCPEAIYADPPYAGTRGYCALPPLEHAKFWAYCQEWAARGVRVFASEYACPVGADVVWEKLHSLKAPGGTQNESRLERLFRVRAPSVARCA